MARVNNKRQGHLIQPPLGQQVHLDHHPLDHPKGPVTIANPTVLHPRLHLHHCLPSRQTVDNLRAPTMEALTSHPLVHDRLAVDQTRSAFVMLVLPNVPGIELPEELMIPLLVKIRTRKLYECFSYVTKLLCFRVVFCLFFSPVFLNVLSPPKPNSTYPSERLNLSV